MLTDVGSIPQNFGTSPWGLVLGNIFYPAFLPVELAAYYLFALSAITLAVTAFIVFNETKKFSSRLGKLSIALFILPAPFIISLYWGNAGSILCCLLLICCVECVAWLSASMLTATSPLTLLIEMLNANVGGGGQFTGVMMPFFQDEPSKAMMLSMAVGVVFIVWLHRQSTQKNFLSMYPAAVAAVFWSYSMNNEHFLLILPTLCCFLIMLESDERRLMWLTAGVATQFYYTFLSMCLAAFGITGVWFCFVFIAMSLCISRRLAALRR
ncbi:MAG: hypothetical protein IJ668_03270 [Selenomonadaceae bacterium]|nr:hypothetical protein [Selenomonadaceae bacterium]